MATDNSLEYYMSILYDAVYRGDFEETIGITSFLSRFNSWRPTLDLLCTALVYKHLEIARLFLSQGCEVNGDRKRHGGYTALHLAVLYGDSMIVQIMLKKGANLNFINLEGMTPLHLLVYRNHDEAGRFPSDEVLNEESSAILDLLFKAGSNINTPVTFGVKQGFTVLHLSAECGNENVIPLLLNKKADLNMKAREGLTPLHIAAINGYSGIVKLFLKYGAVAFQKDAKKKSPLRWALEKRHEAVAELLINYENPPSQKHTLPQVTDDNRVLLSAINLGNISFVESLLKKGVPINTYWRNRENALHVAVNTGIEEMVNLILNHGANFRTATKDGKTPLYLAVERGVPRIVEILLRRVAEDDSMILLAGPSGCTPLHVAVMSDNQEIVRLLLLKGFRVYGEILSNTFYNNSGESLLHIAAKNDNFSICKLLLDHGADIDVKDGKGRNAIYFAADRGNFELVNSLSDISLKRAPRPNEWKEGYAALYASAYNGNSKIVDLLLKKGVDLKANIHGYSTPLHVAVERGHDKVVELLLEKGFDVNEKRKSGSSERGYEYTPLLCAAKTGNLKIVKMLSEKGADIHVKTDKNQTPLFVAVLFNHVNVIQYLVDRGTDLNIIGQLNQRVGYSSFYMYNPCIDYRSEHMNCTPLALAVAKRNIKIVDILLEKGASVDVQNEESSALHFAARYASGEIVGKLLQHGAKINSRCGLGHTPVSHAVQGGQTNTMVHLIKKGAKLDTKTEDGDSLLHLAVKFPSPDKEIIKILLDCGVDVKARNKNQQTALHCFVPPEEIAKEKNLYTFLLDYGAEINAQDNRGNTPLHAATERADIKSVKILLKFEADINVENLNGYTALELMYHINHEQIHYREEKSIAKLFAQVIAIRETAGLYVKEKNLQVVKGNEIKSYYEECMKELNEMICTKVTANVSLGDILIKHVSNLDMYFKYRSVVKALDSTNYKIHFPIYTPILNTRIQKAKERKQLFESSINHLKSILDFEFPWLVVLNIFTYLSSVDLKNMARVFQSPRCLHRFNNHSD